MYTVDGMLQIAKRENNTKRSYLMVNRLQGKYMPVQPQEALALFGELAEILQREYAGEQSLVIGFAETATAIGAAVSVALGCPYLQTTRENVVDGEYLYFLEEHSHAAEQRVVKNGLDYLYHSKTRIIFVDDELTTGKTIRNISTLLAEEYGDGLKFSAASVINCMDETAKRKYAEEKITIHALAQADKNRFDVQTERFLCDGLRHKRNGERPGIPYQILELKGAVNARKLTDGVRYKSACENLWQQFLQQNGGRETGARQILVLGTEEFMYPALYIAQKLEEAGHNVSFYATTRGPVEVSRETDYPLWERYELDSLYEENRTIYLYNLQQYEAVYVITDAVRGKLQGEYTLVNALVSCGNTNITFIYWNA